jgi:hypothetical protein
MSNTNENNNEPKPAQMPSLRPMGGGNPPQEAGGGMPSLQPMGGGQQSMGGGQQPMGGGQQPAPSQQSAPSQAPAGPPKPYVPPTSAAANPVSLPRDYDEFKPNRTPLYIGGGVIALLLVGLFMVFKPSGPTQIPTSYETFKAPDGSFSLEAPVGWAKTVTGKSAGETLNISNDGIELSSGGSNIQITFSDPVELVKNQLLFGSDLVPAGMTGAKSPGLLQMQKRGAKNKFKNYKQTLMPDCPSNMGAMYLDETTKKFRPDAALYEFTASGKGMMGLGGSIRGYRAAMTGGGLIASVVCDCPESEWVTVKPVFLKVIGSVTETGGKEKSERMPGLSPVGGM